MVRERGGRWQAESGQYLLEFDGDPADGSLSVIERNKPAAVPSDAQDWFDRGVALEREDAEAALQAYAQAIAADPALLDGHINFGRLLHESGHFAKAEQVYREAAKTCGSDPVLLYNLGVLLDDMDRDAEALQAYESALSADPDLADCHYNLALLYEKLGKAKEAIRHMSRYRALAKSRPN